MLKKIEGMKMHKKLNAGYAVVISLMIISGLISIVGLASLYYELNSYVNGAQKADTAVKVCRINVNIAARNILQMALSEDTGTYSGYRQTVEERLTELTGEIKTLHDTDIVADDLYNRYVEALNKWVPIGYNIVELLEEGKEEEAFSLIFTESVPALDEVVKVSTEIDEVIAAKKERAIFLSKIMAVVGCISIVLFIIVATLHPCRNLRQWPGNCPPVICTLI